MHSLQRGERRLQRLMRDCRVSFPDAETAVIGTLMPGAAWHNGDLAVFRDGVQHLAESGVSTIEFDMLAMHRLPPGFAGLLWNWRDKGLQIRLRNVEPTVQKMRWFSMTAIAAGDGFWDIVSDPVELREPQPV